MTAGFIFKQCDCPDPDTGRPLYGRCPHIRLAKGQWNPDHGKWAYRIPLLPATPGKARPLIRHGLCACRKLRPRISGSMSVLVEDAAESVVAADVQVGDAGGVGDRCRDRA